MKLELLYNFISPVTGRVMSCPDYVLVGNSCGIATPSPILIDMKLDMIEIKKSITENDIHDLTFILSEPSEKTPNAQALTNLNDGFIFNTNGIISTIAVPPLPPLTEKKLWIGDNTNTAVETQTINLENLPSLGTTDVPNPISLDFVGQIYEGTSSGIPKVSNIIGDIFADIALINLRFVTAKFVLNDGNAALQALMPASQFLSNVTSGLPIQISSNPLTAGKIEVAELPYNYLWVGDAQGRVSSQPNIILSNLPNLTEGKIWKGDLNNRPIEADANIAPNDAKYILQQANNNLVNAQALDLLGTGLLKVVVNGVIELAIVGVDYPSVASVEAAQTTADNALAQAIAAPEEGAALAAIYFNEQMLPYSLIPVIPVGISISGAIGAVSVVAETAQITADNANTRIDNLTVDLIGDITGNNLISNQIVTTFIPNPIFTGKEYIKIPVGNTLERPNSPLLGMLRVNTDIPQYPPINQFLVLGTPDQINVNNNNNEFTVSISDNAKIYGLESLTIPTGTTLQRPSNPTLGMIRINTDLVSNLFELLGTDHQIKVTINNDNSSTLSFQDNPEFTGTEYMKIPTGTTSQRPSNPTVGMIRCNLSI